MVSVLYVGLYQLWFARGYQEFAGIESSVTTKVIWLVQKCITYAVLTFTCTYLLYSYTECMSMQKSSSSEAEKTLKITPAIV